MRVPLFDFEVNIVQILRLADADLAEGCSSRYSRAQTLKRSFRKNIFQKVLDLKILLADFPCSLLSGCSVL